MLQLSTRAWMHSLLENLQQIAHAPNPIPMRDIVSQSLPHHFPHHSVPPHSHFCNCSTGTCFSRKYVVVMPFNFTSPACFHLSIEIC
mmetsp:Transcript_9341/g.34607  ORF Transcript_9341/g.34607 Transcript_9341/m.34607 type:complete len:87 (-) Transcript_9341:393-653(-)